MKLYADSEARRLRQMVGDALLLVWILVWIEIGKAVHDATMLLARPGEEITAAGNGLAEKLRDASSVVGDDPVHRRRAAEPVRRSRATPPTRSPAPAPRRSRRSETARRAGSAGRSG